MNLYLRQFSDKQLEHLRAFTEQLAADEQQKSIFNFDEPDLDGAERQAKEFVERRKAGYRNIEIKEDEDIRTTVRDFLRRRGVYRMAESEQDTRYFSTIKPNY